MDFEYRLFSVGWAAATIAHEDASIELRVSYLSDALGDLLAAIEALLGGAAEAHCSWQEEPGEYRWIFVLSGRSVELDIRWFDDFYDHKPDDHGLTKFSASVPLLDAAQAFADAAQAVLDQYGEQGYLEKWHEYPFPLDLLRKVQKRISADK